MGFEGVEGMEKGTIRSLNKNISILTAVLFLIFFVVEPPVTTLGWILILVLGALIVASLIQSFKGD